MTRRIADGALIPLDAANTDYKQFKRDLQQGAALLDASGYTMTPAQVTAFLSTIP